MEGSSQRQKKGLESKICYRNDGGLELVNLYKSDRRETHGDIKMVVKDEKRIINKKYEKIEEAPWEEGNDLAGRERDNLGDKQVKTHKDTWKLIWVWISKMERYWECLYGDVLRSSKTEKGMKTTVSMKVNQDREERNN